MNQVFNKIIQGDALEVVKTLPDKSINCIVTSPPYWGLRDYGTGNNQLGLGETPEEYIDKLVELFRELRRVLRDDGIVWLNLGDSFSGKQLQGIPWRVALALQADGWYLRSDIIWVKLNPMPESVTDRPTKVHEYIFLLTKNARYWYDQEAVREKGSLISHGGERKHEKRYSVLSGRNDSGQVSENAKPATETGGRNLRSVWHIATKPYKEAHFAVFPPKLIEPCIRAGCPTKVCVECGEPWVREIEKGFTDHSGEAKTAYEVGSAAHRLAKLRQAARANGAEYVNNRKTIGFFPTCQCNADHRPGVVLDPFIGSGTTAQVAIENGCDWLGVELNPEYIELAKKRIQVVQPVLFTF